MEKNEKSAHKLRGFLLYNPIDKDYFFRVYDDRKNFKDYEIRHYDLEIEIVDNYSSVFEEETKDGFDGYIDYKSRKDGHIKSD